MINLYEKFKKLNRSIKDCQYSITRDGAIKAYYGVSVDGLFRISFLSSRSIGIKGDTKAVSIVQGESSDGNYWTCFDLRNDDLLSVFCSFGEDLISCVANDASEVAAASKLRLRYSTWLALFRKTRHPLSEEKARGLFGELYFLKTEILPNHDEETAIESWVGPEQFSKDFSLNDTWFEIKAIGSSSAVVKISSLAQLSSNFDGHLIVVRLEEMSDAYDNPNSSINELIQDILTTLDSNESKDLFIRKVGQYGYDFSDEAGNKKYSVKKIEKYNVDNSFPILRECDIHSDAVNNVSYELIIKMLKDWLEDEK